MPWGIRERILQQVYFDSYPLYFEAKFSVIKLNIYDLNHIAVDKELLLEYGASEKLYRKGEFIFFENQTANFYYQIVSGEVHMCNFNQEGKVHLQGIFGPGLSFGEPPLFGGFPYPASAMASRPSVLLCIQKPDFLKMIKANPDVHFHFTSILSNRLRFKARMASEISINPPEKRILSLLTYMKENIYEFSPSVSYQVKLTRQEIADLTGLRVETVIRTIKTLEKNGSLEIRSRKIWI